MPCLTFKDKNNLPVFLTVGGPDLEITWRSKTWLFEMHHYCGPVLINRRTGQPLNTEPPKAFWSAFELWELGGKEIKDGKCILAVFCKDCDGNGFTLGEKIRIKRKTGHEAIECKTCKGSRIQPKREQQP